MSEDGIDTAGEKSHAVEIGGKTYIVEAVTSTSDMTKLIAYKKQKDARELLPLLDCGDERTKYLHNLSLYSPTAEELQEYVFGLDGVPAALYIAISKVSDDFESKDDLAEALLISEFQEALGVVTVLMAGDRGKPTEKKSKGRPKKVKKQTS